MRRTARSRSLAPLAVLALVAFAATGCNDDGGSSSKDTDAQETVVVDENGQTIGGDPDAVGPLSADQAAQAVLQSDNMGEGWSATPSTEDDTEAPGCLADIDTLTEGLTKTTKAGTEFAYGDAELPFVESTVSAYEDPTAIAAVFDQVQTALGACTTIDAPDGDGNQWQLTLNYDEAATYDVDDQLHIAASGTITSGGGDPTQIYIEWSNFRVGANVGGVTTIDTEPRSDESAAWTAIAVDRLLKVAAGEEPAATTAPAPATS
ncbi:hypothetical protein F0U44_14310 [Nocardioides humilatus]|uniref:Sensor domain-containing protein n=1 Tax=Nocardioides humilatus TaxID=2607660 RepID=A0A5B1LIH2_9ACTN|nr:hypothetical protein [Nocardioides humilatus]KAA1419590.1 hypothetical protein F0U44_14310 [Nocardioides humilatus]